MGRRWTDEEVEYLIDNAESMTFEEIGEELGRSQNSVTGKWAYLKKCGHDLSNLKGRKENSWSEEEWQFVEDNYGILSAEDIAEQLERSLSSVYTKVYQLRKKDKLPDADWWTEEEDEKLISMYEWCFDEELRRAFPNRTDYALRKRVWKLRESGVDVPSRKRAPDRYKYDREYFKELNPENCYVAGFIAGDGCYIEDGRVISISQHTDDEIHLRGLKKLMSFEGKLEPGDGDCYRFRIHGAGDLYQDLNKHFNITATKSLTLKPPNISNKYLIISYIAGIIDSDGGIYRDGSRHRTLIAGTEYLLSWIKRYIDDYYPGKRKPSSVRPAGSISQYGFGGSRLSALKKDLIPMNLPLMARKWDDVGVVF